MKVTRITLGRLYNTGSYEHIRYDVTVELADGDSAKDAMIGLEKLMTALSPNTSTRDRDQLRRDGLRVEELKAALAAMTDQQEFKRKYGWFEGTPAEYVDRCEKSHLENVARRDAWEKRSEKARKLLDDLGGAAKWKDAKLDWELDDDDF